MELNPTLAAAAEEMLLDGFVEGLGQRLRRDFPTMHDYVTTAIAHAVEKLIARPLGREPDNPRAYLATCAYNEMKREAMFRARHESLDALRDDQDTPFEVADRGWTVEERALINEVYRELRAFVETWETDHVRVVTLLYLQAAYEGEPLPSEEAAQIAGDILEEELDPAFVRTWKSRGYRRLREHVGRLAQEEASTGGAPR